MNLGVILLIVLLVVLLGGLPNWGYHQYGWGPSGIVGILLVVLLVLLLMGRL
jgi:flagellar basal body-associated protein FliL